MSKKLERLALEIAALGHGELTRKEIEVRMQAITAGLSAFDRGMVVQQAAAIARERAAMKIKQAAALNAFGQTSPETWSPRPREPRPEAMSFREEKLTGAVAVATPTV